MHIQTMLVGKVASRQASILGRGVSRISIVTLVDTELAPTRVIEASRGARVTV